MTPADLLATTPEDGRILLEAAASDWSRPIPHCPDWDAGGLVAHLGGIFSWMGQIVTTGQRVSRADRELPPDDLEQLSPWYLAHLERTAELLATTDPDTATWTFSSREVSTVAWWCRRLAVETAIHRWDMQYAVALEPTSIPALDRAVAVVGVDEFIDEFLPGLVAGAEVTGLSGLLELRGNDVDRRWSVDLDQLRGNEQGPKKPVAIEGSASDLLLWLTNRAPSTSVRGDAQAELVAAWNYLRR